MSHLRFRSLALACSGATLALCLLGATVHASPASAAPDLPADRVTEALQATGYSVGAPMAWGDQAQIIEARTGGGRVVRAFVYRDAQAAAAARRAAHAQQAPSTTGTLAYSEDVGPQLLSGFGASAWRGNLALVQSSPEVFAELMPVEPDCDPAPPAGPELSRPAYRVDATILQLFDQVALTTDGA